MPASVYIITWCSSLENLYGSTLIFKTLRKGFPNARVHVIENGSAIECRQYIKRHAYESEASFFQLEESSPHHEVLEKIIYSQKDGSSIFLDPDILLWDNIEGWEFDSICAGRKIPTFYCEYTGCITHARLHTSLFWIPDINRLRYEIETVILRNRMFEFYPFRPFMFKVNGLWQRLDTGASLYGSLSERMHAFTPDELDSYDHLFCGSHLERVAPMIREDYSLSFRMSHDQARKDYTKLKGIWRSQDDYFKSCDISINLNASS